MPTVLAVIVGLPLAGLLAYRVVPPPVTPLMLIRAVEGEGLSYRWRPLAEIDPRLPAAIVAAEDNNFCLHGGIDWAAAEEAYREWQASGRLRGASTISMQLAKNLFLWPRFESARWLDIPRKALELPLALLIDAVYGKRRVMELYVNVVELGPGLYGAQAGAEGWFGRQADNLTAAQAAALARQLPAPRARRADQGVGTGRARTIQQRVDQLGPDRQACWQIEERTP